jgi:hypothetical protein
MFVRAAVLALLTLSLLKLGHGVLLRGVLKDLLTARDIVFRLVRLVAAVIGGLSTLCVIPLVSIVRIGPPEWRITARALMWSTVLAWFTGDNPSRTVLKKTAETYATEKVTSRAQRRAERAQRKHVRAPSRSARTSSRRDSTMSDHVSTERT